MPYNTREKSFLLILAQLSKLTSPSDPSPRRCAYGEGEWCGRDALVGALLAAPLLKTKV
jgi:hypothetical protein